MITNQNTAHNNQLNPPFFRTLFNESSMTPAKANNAFDKALTKGSKILSFSSLVVGEAAILALLITVFLFSESGCSKS